MGKSALWFKEYTLESIAEAMGTAPSGREGSKNIVELLGLELTEITDHHLKARMPVDMRTHQIHGILHGGATCVLTETVGSIASLLCIDLEKYYAVGSMITANHLRPVREGHVTATCRPVHIGRTKHVWDILVHDDGGGLVAKSELTCAVTEKR